VVGDLLCLAGAFLYAVSNVGQEGVVKQYDRVEFLAMIGLFGSGLNVTQAYGLSYGDVISIAHCWIGLYLNGMNWRVLIGVTR
jgi:drug/metabolite transporter (DMT)-like permease